MNLVMFPLALAPTRRNVVPHWDPPMVIVGKLLAIAVLVALNGFFRRVPNLRSSKCARPSQRRLAASGNMRAHFVTQRSRTIWMPTFLRVSLV